ncbi:MAG: hypothetical protein F4Y27_02770 [Acidimicrobiaceae bacterium]|nr:hypothetical protein [Acidimicrobiaceae bacterium]MYA73588.1 hypothetical protein [Acidimicrobiaceae bacterium]MYC41523.1 hypothetical protein [Acidimicrobiaceae bacterium]MYG56233.1 hypothetical protein [Acidimicrobiaceae bacterium]MYH88695.1 hypothetical protein [Acidimicrobiaceae bacterium]
MLLRRVQAATAAQRLCWLATGLWIVQPFLLGPLLSDGLGGASDSFSGIVTLASWLGWLGVLISLVARLPVTLAVARIGTAGTLPVAVWAAIESQDTTLAVIGIVGSLAVTAAVLAPGVADSFIDGASYGDERRFALRPPGPVLVVLVVPAWAVVIGGSTVGPILLVDQRWLAGAVATVIGVPLAALAFNALYRLTGRFIVLVPNGLVLHDRTVLREPVLFARREIVGLGPADADTSATDLTASALGLALELKLHSTVTLPLVTGRKTTHERQVRSLLISPSRPADVMRHANQRGINIA